MFRHFAVLIWEPTYGEYRPSPNYSSTPKLLDRRKDECSTLFEKQMQNPSEIISVILILSGRHVTFVSFSFGWVAYSFSALMNVFGDGTFMPRPDYPASVITVDLRIEKVNDSWAIGRLIRELELQIENDMKTWINPPEKPGKKPKKSGECHSRWEAPQHDKLYRLFFIIPLIQLLVAAIPIITQRDWSILIMTAIGVILAIMTGSNSENSYIITRGNGHRYVFVVFADNSGSGLFLDDLAGVVTHANTRIRLASVVFATLWIIFLIVAGGLKNHTWFLLAVGGPGVVQNIFAVEDKYPRPGLAIRPEFFPDQRAPNREPESWANRKSSQHMSLLSRKFRMNVRGQPRSDWRRRNHSVD
ncbi:hypothetical protein K469DRAFT_725800 [Zopfia rhizophila CBS 207.26]|uniref:Uncharacterized protein n=1 Tax=Zopfia rhizophila CBS 207.26 TaxID=1314779 RepID=A0A6A6EQJ6_9PEZI|nr:hypothetical protein K469DRAFT_725800 [Zopfia rhizophila CBS 207.26]